MRKKFFVLAIVSLTLISKPTFCAEQENESTILSKKAITSAPMDQEVERKDITKDKTTSTSEQKEKPKINDLVEFLKYTEIIIPEKLMHIKNYFSKLEGKNLVEQYQYDGLLEAYTKELKKAQTDSSKNPAAIAILSDTGYIKGSTVETKDQNSGPKYHSEQKLITSLVVKKGYNLKGLKIGLYTRNSPCILRVGGKNIVVDKHEPCINYINFIVTKSGRKSGRSNPALPYGTEAASIMTQYDLIYDDPRSNQKNYIDSYTNNFKKINKALIEITESRQKEYKSILNELKNNKDPIVAKLLQFDSRLERDKKQCLEAKRFRDIAKVTFIGSAFNKAYSVPYSSLILTRDIKKLSYEIHKSTELIVDKFLETIKDLEKTKLQSIKKVLMEIYQIAYQ